MLTLEQFRNEEMQALYQQYLVSGPVGYVKDLFKSMGVVEADKKATMFYSIMFFYYSLYDGAKDKTRIKDSLKKVLEVLYRGRIRENTYNKNAVDYLAIP